MKPPKASLTVVFFLANQGPLWSGEKPTAPAPEAPPAAELQMDLALVGLWTGVHGDSARFRQQQQHEAPFSGGIEKFWWAGKIDDGLNFELDGRALYAEDWGLNMLLTKDDVGSLKFSGDTYRRYYDSTIADSPFTPFIRDDVEQELYTTRGLYSIEGILALPNLPKVTLGYERDGKDGNQNLPWGGWVRQAPPGNDWIMWNNPLSREVDYTTDRIYFGMEHTLGGFKLKFREEWEQFDGTQYHREPGDYTNGTHVFDRYYNSSLDYTMWTTRLDATKELIDDKLILNLGYVYQSTDNNNNFDSDARTPAGLVHDAEHSINFNDNTHDGSLGRQIATASLTWHPASDMTFFGGLNYTYGDADSAANRNEEGSGGSGTDNNPATNEEMWRFNTDTIEDSLSESLRATFSQLPKTRVTLSADFEQTNVDYDWNATIWTAGIKGESTTGQGDWLWDADTDYRKYNWGINLRSDPWQFLTANLNYKYKLLSADVNEGVDSATKKPGDPEYEPTATPAMYYPGRIEGWDQTTHVTSLSFDIKPVRSVTVRPVVEWETSEYDFNDQLDGNHEISNFDRFGYGIAMDLQLASRTTLTLNYMNQDITTETEAKDHSTSIGKDPFTGAPNAGYYGALIDSFDGSYETLSGVLTYTDGKFTTSLNAGLTNGEGTWETQYYWAGLNAAYRLTDNLTMRAGYSYYQYSEDNNNNVNNYTANGAFLGLRYQF